MHAADRAVMADPEIGGPFLAGAVEAVRNGSRGLADDMVRLFGRGWGIRPADVRVPVRLWYGDADTLVPPAMGRYLSAAIPAATLDIEPGEGHLLWFTRWPEIAGWLTSG
jgi:pimeloyl-ACP methyl ester carboxylesterase